jgi:hypothetical protein
MDIAGIIGGTLYERRWRSQAIQNTKPEKLNAKGD